MTDTSYDDRISTLQAVLERFVAGNETLRARIIELEAELALLRGSLAPTPAPDEPATITHDVLPNAPR